MEDTSVAFYLHQQRAAITCIQVNLHSFAMLRASAAEDRAVPTVERVPAALMPGIHIKDATPPAELFPPLGRKGDI